MIVSGAGPAGAICATLLARRGLRVELFDRTRFPRAKLCGDTLNPGALRVLAGVRPVDDILVQALPLDGMLLTGPDVAVRATYGGDLHGYALVRRDLDALLLADALNAGVQFHERTTVLSPLVDAAGAVAGVTVRCADGRSVVHRARFVVAADGRASRLAKALGLSHHPRPRRWAIGGYFRDADIDRRYGQMHVRQGHYIGVAPVRDGLVNVCLVVPHTRGDGGWRNASLKLRDVVRRDPMLNPRFADAELIDKAHVLGPMAVDVRTTGVPGLVLAGDAAGFIDPITGDGLRLALESAVLAANVVGEVFAGQIPRECAADVLARRRRAAFSRKWRFNRLIRRIVDAPAAVSGAALAARVMPSAFEAVIRYAGDAS